MAGAAAARPLAAFGQAVDNAKQASSPSALRITEVKCGYVRGSLFVKIHTNQGIWGCGEAVDAIQGTYHMVQSFGQRLRNQSPLNVHRLFEQIRKGGVFGGAQSGVFIAVLSAMETALWDLAGKALNVPVYQLLGGKFRDRIRLYLIPRCIRQAAHAGAVRRGGGQGAKDGYTAVKFDLDQADDPNKYDQFNWTASPAEIQRMVDQMTAARRHGTQLRHLRRHARPLRFSDRAEGRQADGAAESDVARGAGAGGKRRHLQADRPGDQHTDLRRREHLPPHGFRRLLETGGVDIIMPDLQKAGGLGEGQRIANLANLYYVPFAPHMVASFLGAMARATSAPPFPTS